MDKRNLVKGVAVGTIAAIMAGTGGKSVFASPQSFRDKLLEESSGFEIVLYRNRDEDFSYRKITVIKFFSGKIEVSHVVCIAHKDGDGRSFEYPVFEHKMFDTLEEAFKYAKKLKTQYYG